MPRKPRFNLPGVPQHIVQRGKHSLQTDRPKLVSDWIERFLDGGVNPSVVGG